MIIRTERGWVDLDTKKIVKEIAPVVGEVVQELQAAEPVKLASNDWSFERILQWNIHLAQKVGVQVIEWYGGAVVFGRYNSWTIRPF